MTDDGTFDFKRPDALALSLDDVVGTADEPVVAIFIFVGAVTSNIPAFDEIGFVFFGSFPDLRHLGSKAFLQSQIPFGQGRQFVTMVVNNRGMNAGEGFAHRTNANIHTGVIADHDGAGFGLPPGIMEGVFENTIRPEERLGVQRFADTAQMAKRG